MPDRFLFTAPDGAMVDLSDEGAGADEIARAIATKQRDEQFLRARR